MQLEEVRAFKNELRNYNFYLSQERTLINSIEFLYDRLGGVRGVDPSKEPLHVVPNKELEWKIRDDISALDAKLTVLREKIRYIESILTKMEIDGRQAVIAVYACRHRMEDECIKYNYSPQGFNHYLNRVIKEALDEI